MKTLTEECRIAIEVGLLTNKSIKVRREALILPHNRQFLNEQSDCLTVPLSVFIKDAVHFIFIFQLKSF